ncbi:transcriptional regulator [Pseudomonas syringae]|nr:transcriptional regulator [Pseudomonas syringae]
MIIAIILPYGDAVLLRHIRYLLAVSDHGNFTRAAEALHVSQPALSQQIRQLESSLGVQLFDRTRRSVVPTDAGRVYLDHARRCLLELEAGKRALNDVSDLSRGQLRLGVTPTFSEYLIAPLIDRFSALYPGVAIILTELPLEQITEALINEALDLAIGFAGSHAVEIESQPLFDEQLCLVMAKSAPEKQTALTLEDLQTLRFALLAPDSPLASCWMPGARRRISSLRSAWRRTRSPFCSRLLPRGVWQPFFPMPSFASSPGCAKFRRPLPCLGGRLRCCGVKTATRAPPPTLLPNW